MNAHRLGLIALAAAITACAGTPGPGDAGYPYNVEGAYTGSITVNGVPFAGNLTVEIGEGGVVRGTFNVTQPAGPGSASHGHGRRKRVHRRDELRREPGHRVHDAWHGHWHLDHRQRWRGAEWPGDGPRVRTDTASECSIHEVTEPASAPDTTARPRRSPSAPATASPGRSRTRLPRPSNSGRTSRECGVGSRPGSSPGGDRGPPRSRRAS